VGEKTRKGMNTIKEKDSTRDKMVGPKVAFKARGDEQDMRGFTSMTW
jgi:hypothetical protein